jgi:hypothetical protein
MRTWSERMSAIDQPIWKPDEFVNALHHFRTHQALKDAPRIQEQSGCKQRFMLSWLILCDLSRNVHRKVDSHDMSISRSSGQSARFDLDGTEQTHDIWGLPAHKWRARDLGAQVGDRACRIAHL